VSSVPSSGLSLETRRAAFNAVWNKVNEQFFDPTFGGVDWKAVKKKYAPLADKAKSDAEFYEVLERMVKELKQSHFSIFPPQAYEAASAKSAKPAPETNKANTSVRPEAVLPVPSDSSKPRSFERGLSGITVGFIGGEIVAIRVSPDSPAAKAGIVPGDILEAMNGVKLASAISTAFTTLSGTGTMTEKDKPIYGRMIAQMMVDGRANDTFTYTVRAKDDQTRDVPVTLSAATVGTIIPSLPAMPVEVTSRKIPLVGSEAEGYVGYVHFTPFSVSTLTQVRTALNGMADAKGLIVDLRGNPGGLLPVTYALAGQLSGEKGNLGTMAMRGNTLNFKYEPQGIKYAGPLVILTDELSMSCSEVLAGGLQTNRRAQIIGRATPGKVLPSTTLILPGGARLQYAFADFKTTKGILLEGRGVKPDVPVELTRERLYKEGDPDIEAALQSIRQAKPTAP
jgi:carboxyl-terminal processing protease